ncbi:hypothetical protein [Halobacillus yeomjeoni]|uniref:Uncharacterized protein n=1 Tax=Halobacillus yeomjeoni TaxID=311194 RepID=A0A931HW26_9BACI|nr:hypothetical protein [Halobacillus yeomjeoni]MBH0230855.1 hypothetical protein [Halobacillus yeomjeoni]
MERSGLTNAYLDIKSWLNENEPVISYKGTNDKQLLDLMKDYQTIFTEHLNLLPMKDYFHFIEALNLEAEKESYERLLFLYERKRMIKDLLERWNEFTSKRVEGFYTFNEHLNPLKKLYDDTYPKSEKQKETFQSLMIRYDGLHVLYESITKEVIPNYEGKLSTCSYNKKEVEKMKERHLNLENFSKRSKFVYESYVKDYHSSVEELKSAYSSYYQAVNDFNLKCIKYRIDLNEWIRDLIRSMENYYDHTKKSLLKQIAEHLNDHLTIVKLKEISYLLTLDEQVRELLHSVFDNSIQEESDSEWHDKVKEQYDSLYVNRHSHLTDLTKKWVGSLFTEPEWENKGLDIDRKAFQIDMKLTEEEREFLDEIYLKA